ncbi:MAG: LysM peptidoglycan-binding domain-containing protein [Bacteroidales bacterium]|nr:LysM peptidoglycan-binding domain-containing protein [Bacteroidales bacterium]
MKSTISTTLILALALTLTVPGATVAQEYISAPVIVSKEKVKVDGKICYSHIVKEKQTLFSIAKAYEVSIDDIYALNPTLKESGLKKNLIILIPSKETVKEPIVETVVLKEPTQETTVKITAGKKQKTHTVKWYEDLDTIAEKYGITVEALMAANGLTEKAVTKRQKLVIPEPDAVVETEEAVIAEENEDEIISETEDAVVEEEAEDSVIVFVPKEDVKATLILPLKASTDNVSRNNMDFYSGVLLAIKDLAEYGISTELNVYDSSDSSHPISSEDINDSDLIIGPVSSGDLGRLLDSGYDAKAVISPLDSRAESYAYTNGNFIQVPTPLMAQYQDLTEWIREDTMPGDTLLIISEKGARTTDAISQMREAADSSGLTFIPFSYSILEGRDVTEPLTKLMTASGTNRVMIASDSEAFVNDVVRNLNILVYNKLNVVLYAPARIRHFETIEVENLHNTSLHASLGYLIDYEDMKVKNFLLKYRALYNTEPSQYAFQGYDIATFFIGMCSKYGSDWIMKLDGSENHMLQSTFKFTYIEDGGFVNKGIRRVVYGNGWSVTKTR